MNQWQVVSCFSAEGLQGCILFAREESAGGRGIGSALTWVALDYARCRGIPTAVLQSSNDGKGLYTRLGFSSYCDFAEFTTD
jgi:predicted N-acetyltransferase YhbS